MKQYVSLFLICFCLPTLAGEKIDRTLAAEPNGTVEIHNVRGKIAITGWPNEEVKVSGTLDDMTEEFIFTSEGSKTLIKVKLPRHTNFHNRDGSNLTIHVPLGSKVAFSGVATDLDVQKVDGGLEINSVSGEIFVQEIKGRTYINSVSGGLKLQTLSGILEVSTVSGDLQAQVECKKVRVSGVSADLDLKLKEIESASLSNVSGDTMISGVLMSDGELKLSSVSGEAFYLVEGTLDARVSMETAPGGDIINEYTDDKPISSFINSHNLRFTTGSGNATIRMSTVSGNIGLKKK
jgi:hypothetical protein